MAKLDSVDRLYRNAVALHKAGDLNAAAKDYSSALELNPTHLPSLNNLAATRAALGDSASAATLYRSAIALHPDAAESHGNLGNLLRDIGDLEGAAEHYAACLEYAPGSAEVRYALGVVLRALGHSDTAATHLWRAAKELVRDPNPWIALAVLALERNETEEASSHIAKALDVASDNADALNVLGLISRARADFVGARKAFDQALAADPNHAEGNYNRGTLRLLLGDWLGGWADFEWRWKNRPPLTGEPTHLPQWRGEPLRGKTVLLLGEQGYGDTIQFIRFAPRLKAMGARVIVHCRSALHRLIAEAPGVDGVGNLGDAVDAQVWSPLMSLPFILGTREHDIPANEGYFRLPRPLTQEHGVRRIGLVWAGSPTHGNDAIRSIRLEDLAPILSCNGYAFCSLQMGERRNDLSQYSGKSQIVDIMSNVTDFRDTAERLADLDALISVDTAVAHLAGAMGIPTFVLLPHVPDWRWMLSRPDTPWYRSMRLFRQSSPGNWLRPVLAMREVLSDLSRP